MLRGRAPLPRRNSPKRFNGHPPLGVNATRTGFTWRSGAFLWFQWAPTLGGECYTRCRICLRRQRRRRFNGHPPLGVNATPWFASTGTNNRASFNGHPPLGVNATQSTPRRGSGYSRASFNGHPPLGVNATEDPAPDRGNAGGGQFQWAPTLGGECYTNHAVQKVNRPVQFQWAPTLGGECYGIVYLITPPLCQGGNALLNISQRF